MSAVATGTETPEWTIRSAAAALRSGEVTAVALAQSAHEAADRLDPEMGTWLDRYSEQSMARAEQADAELAAGCDLGPLHGIPLGVKDILSTDEGPTTAQSLTLEPDWGEQGDGPVVARLRSAGGLIMGKTTTMEYAIGRPDFSKPFPVPRNPWNLDRWTGGSSSGTGNGVASGQILGGLGTDTGGSVRLPASYNGISGHKPTFGLVPKSGCVPLGMSYDHVGPLARSAWDCAAMLSVMAGADPSDRTTVDRPAVDYVGRLDHVLQQGLEGVSIGIIANDSIADGSDDSTMAVFDDAIAAMETAGATTKRLQVPLYEELAAGAFLGLQAEAFSWHRDRLAARWNDYGRPTRLTIVQGALISAGDIVQIERVRQVARSGVGALVDAERVDVLVSPTTGYGATPFTGGGTDALSIKTLHTPAWNSTGWPALSVPMGFDPDGLPLGLQIIGRPFADDLVLAVGHAYQQVTDWHLRTPPHRA